MRRLVLLMLHATSAFGLDIRRADFLARGCAAAAGLCVSRQAWAAADEAAKPQKKVIYRPPSVKEKSTPDQIALAKHLTSQGAKMYGAYWCSHCYDQKVAFGSGGTQLLGYVECAEDGYNSQRGLCSDKKIRGYPTWEIGGEFYPGEQSLRDLADLSGFKEASKFGPADEE